MTVREGGGGVECVSCNVVYKPSIATVGHHDDHIKKIIDKLRDQEVQRTTIPGLVTERARNPGKGPTERGLDATDDPWQPPIPKLDVSFIVRGY